MACFFSRTLHADSAGVIIQIPDSRSQSDESFQQAATQAQRYSGTERDIEGGGAGGGEWAGLTCTAPHRTAPPQPRLQHTRDRATSRSRHVAFFPSVFCSPSPSPERGPGSASTQNPLRKRARPPPHKRLRAATTAGACSPFLWLSLSRSRRHLVLVLVLALATGACVFRRL